LVFDKEAYQEWWDKRKRRLKRARKARARRS